MWGACVVTAVFLAMLLPLIAGLLPASVKKIGFFSMAIGLIVGGAIGWQAARMNVRRRRGAVVLSVICTVVVLVVISIQGHERLRDHRAREMSEQPDGQLALTIIENVADDDPAAIDDARVVRAYYFPSWRDYLAMRVSPLGEWPFPWPLAFWLAEVGLSSAAAAWMVRRQMKHAK